MAVSEYPTWLEINLTRLDANLAWWRGLLQGTADPGAAKPATSSAVSGGISPSGGASTWSLGSRSKPAPAPAWAAAAPVVPTFCAVIKADAYGLGAVEIARRLEMRGVDFLAVFSIAEALTVVAAAIKSPLLVFMPCRTVDLPGPLRLAAADQRLHLAVHDLAQLEQVNLLGRSLGKPVAIHLHLDTGMSRGGLTPKQLPEVLQGLASRQKVALHGIYTHFARAADDAQFTSGQLHLLRQCLQANKAMLPANLLVHAAATFAAARDRQVHCDMIRVGLGLYGYGPEQLPAGSLLAGACPRPIVRWLAQLVQIQQLPAGAPVGYDSTIHLARPSRLGIVPAGYGLGYPQCLGNQAVLRLLDAKGNPAALLPVVGKVNMDQVIVDCTDAPLAKLGDTVEIYSDDPAAPNALPRIAQAAHSSCYELLCRLSARLPRRYIEQKV